MKYLMCTIVPPALMTLIGSAAGGTTEQLMAMYIINLTVSFITTCLHAAWNVFTND